MKFLDTHGSPAEIVFEPVAFGLPLAVWVFAFHDGRLALGRRREGGLVWPIASLGPGEDATAAARRACVETVGARVSELTAIAQFRGVRPDGGPRRSTIYVARLVRLDPLPVDSLMAGVELKAPNDLSYLEDGAPFMRDPAFTVVLTYLNAKELVPG